MTFGWCFCRSYNNTLSGFLRDLSDFPCRAASKEATSFLQVTDIKNRVRERLIKKCKSNQRRFEERITKQKIQGFTEKDANFKLTNKNILTDGARFILKHFVYCFTTEKWYPWNAEVFFCISSSLSGSHWWINAKGS